MQFGSPKSPLDLKIRGGNGDLVTKLSRLAPYKLTGKQAEDLPPFENAKIVSVEHKSPDDPFDPRAVEDVTNAGPEEEESFPAILTGVMSGSLANNPAVFGRTEYVNVATQSEWRGSKETSYAAYGEFSDLQGKGAYTKREYRWDSDLKRVTWKWVY